MESEKKAKGLGVTRTKAEPVRALLASRGLIDRSLKPFESKGTVHFPIAGDLSPNKLNALRAMAEGLDLAQGVWGFMPRNERATTLHRILKDRVPDHVLARVPRSFDTVGDMAVVELDEGVGEYGPVIGEALATLNSRIRLVLAKIAPVSGKFRVAQYRTIYGEGNTETVHRENGCVFVLDVKKVFFTPRMSTERVRVARSVIPNETVADLFAGVGPFSILIAKGVRGVTVHAVELNEFAYRYLLRNVSANKVTNAVTPHLGDARSISRTTLRAKCDRVIMNLPFASESFLDAATNSLKPQGGLIHLYTTATGHASPQETFSRVAQLLKGLGWGSARQEMFRVVREVGPRVYSVVIDVRVANQTQA